MVVHFYYLLCDLKLCFLFLIIDNVFLLVGKIIVKGATQVSGQFLKLHFCMFEKSQKKHNNLDCHDVFWNIF
jgi:hypothetical protein